MHGIINPNQGPWGGRTSGTGGDGDGNDSRKPRPVSGNNQGDLDALLRDAQNKFKSSFGRGPTGAQAGGGLGLILLVIIGFWLVSGFYRIQPSENVVVMTFGKWTSTNTDSGLSWHIPWPIQSIEKVDVALDRRIAVGFQGMPAPRSIENNTAADIPFESLMLTGDENIINIDFVVLWRVSDAGKYLFSIRDPDTTIKKVAESAMREIIGRTQIQKALTEGRGDIEARTKELMQKILDDYSAGIVVNSVQLQKVDPPAPVVDAFDDVQRSRADKERAKNEAETYANDIVPRARGDAQKLIQDAEAYKQAVIAKAEGDAQRFLSVYDAYKESKDVTEKRMYLETMQGILQGSKHVVIGDGNAPVLPYLPLDQEKKK